MLLLDVQRVRVVSYNIHSGVGSDGVYNLPRVACYVRSNVWSNVRSNVDPTFDFEWWVTKIQDWPFHRLTFCFLFYASGWTFVGGARVVNGAEKKIIWSRRPRLAASIKCDERPLKGGVWSSVQKYHISIPMASISNILVNKATIKTKEQKNK